MHVVQPAAVIGRIGQRHGHEERRHTGRARQRCGLHHEVQTQVEVRQSDLAVRVGQRLTADRAGRVAGSGDVGDAVGVEVGDEIDFTITGDIPNVAVIDGYKIVDTLDDKLDYVSAAVSLVDGTPLAAGDYTIVHDAATNAVTVEFTASGLAVLAAHPATQVQVVVTTEVNTVGEIANTAVLYPNAGSYTVLPGEPGGPTVTPEVITKWGDITVEKTDKAGAPLTGAVFSVYPTEQDAIDGTNAIALAGSTEFAVAADGTVTISGLRYSDWADNLSLIHI